MAMIPDITDLPEIQAHSINALRLRDVIGVKLPSITNLGINKIVEYSARQMEIARLQEAMRIAYEITRRQNMIAAARAARKDQILQSLAQKRRTW